MMIQHQDTAVKPPDGTTSGKVAKQKGGLGVATVAAANGGTPAEQQAQPCPRCDSLNTKFCYFNNYSSSQPRHFCKNCRRYWTKGGALRNVPVGGGCRKNKRLKHRDPSCMAALADMDPSASSSLLASINSCGMPSFGSSTSSLIQDLANEGHRLALSRFGMPLFDKRFVAENEYINHQGGVSTQDLFTLGGKNGGAGPSGALLGSYDASFPGLNYPKSDSQALLFHPNYITSHDHQLAPFFDHINVASPFTPTLDHLSSFTSAGSTTAGPHHVTANSVNTSSTMDSQLSLLHHSIHLNGMPASHEMHTREDPQQGQAANSAMGGGFSEESVEMSMATSKGLKPGSTSVSDWTACTTQQIVSSTTDSYFSHVLGSNQANDSGLWNVSWPEMHAALAGSATTAGAILH